MGLEFRYPRILERWIYQKYFLLPTVDAQPLPSQEEKDFDTRCSCPDWSNPCKHIAGVHYLLAAQIDQDPFLLFELRRLSRKDLQAELAKSPLGEALSQELQAQVQEPVPVASYHPTPELMPVAEQNLKEFW